MPDFTDNQGVTKEPFETPEGWVADMDTAHEIADIHNLAEHREEVLRKEHETGLTERERKNLEIAGILKEEFPYALKECLDKETGETYYEVGSSTDPRISRQIDDNHNDRLLNEYKLLMSNQEIIGNRTLQSFLNGSFTAHISQKGIEFYKEENLFAFDHKPEDVYMLQFISPQMQDNFLKVLSYLNHKSEVISSQAEKEKLEITPEGLRDRIKRLKEETLL